ncbi:MAG: hypothetical protein PHV49_05740 [Alistipes sp.]|nr:hypothetical protein [Alistipes sp.]
MAVLLSGVLLLMLSVLPHHHHGHNICFAALEACADVAHERGCHDCAPDHDAEGDCDLKHIFLFSGRHQDLNYTFTDALDSDLSVWNLLAWADRGSEAWGSTPVWLPETSFRYAPWLEGFCRMPDTRWCAGRAPPFFIV